VTCIRDQIPFLGTPIFYFVLWLVAIAPQRVRPKALNFCGEFCGCKGELTSHRGRYVDHLESLGLKTDLFQDAASIFYSSPCVYITFQVMAISNQSASDHNAISAIFKGM
jgi:hypothetical protein